MSKETDFAKTEILACLSKSNSDVGQVLRESMFFQMTLNWNPKQKESLLLAIDELISDGLLEKHNSNCALTQKGVDTLYPSVGRFVRDAIFLIFSESQSRVGSILNSKSLFHKTAYWNPKQKKALKPTLEQLCTEGFIELKGDNYFLTQMGYDAIY